MSNDTMSGESKRRIKDLCMGVGAVVALNAVIQFVLYPFMERRLGSEEYGVALSLISLIAIFAGSVGTSANYSRMITENTLKPKNSDYNYILLIGGALCGIIGIFYLAHLGKANAVNSALFFALMVLTAFRYYSDVSFKMSANFFGYMMFYIAIAVGYVVGIAVYLLTDRWMTALIVGECFGILFVAWRGTIYKKAFARTDKNTGAVCKSMGFLLLSNFIENLTLNADRIILLFFCGGSVVSVFYTASLLGKVIAMLTVPINSLIISYLVKSNVALTKKFWAIAVCAVSALGALAFLCCTLLSPFVLKLLYPSLYDAARAYVAPAIIGQIFYFISGVLLVILLKYRGEKKQFFINLAYLVEFFALIIVGTYAFGLTGFVYFALAANLLRFVAVVLWGFIPAKGQ